MSAISLKNMWKRFYDPSLGQVETPQGVLSLPKLFLPFFLEMFLMNLMSTVNTFTLSFYSDQAVAAVGAAGQFMGMVMTFYSVISTGASIVISQNLGARQYERAKKGARFGIICSVIIAELIGIIIYAAAPVLIAAFNRDPSVIHYGVMQARIIALFYCLLAFSHCIAAVLRGSGHAAVPMVVMLCDWCLFRVSYITVAVRLISDIRVIFWAYPLTWSISSVIFLYLFLRGKWVYGFEK